MARIVRLWGKKRGDRRTGSALLGSLGEALFFGVMFLMGLVALAVILVSWILDPSPNLHISDWSDWLLLLVFGSFILIGGGGVIFTVWQIGASAERKSALARRAAAIDLIGEARDSPKEYPNIPGDANLTNSPGIALTYRLPVARLSVWRLSASTAFCLIWNSCTAVLLAVVVDQHMAGRPEWSLTFALIPFLGVGVWSIYDFVKQLLIQTGIGPTTLEISDHPLHPGRPYRVFVSQSGRLTVRSLKLLLVCQEEAIYRQGTDIRTEARSVHEQLVFRREGFKIEPGTPFSSEVELWLPDHVMHSFHSPHNAVFWKLVVQGDVEVWPPFERSFPVVVYPPSGNSEDEG